MIYAELHTENSNGEEEEPRVSSIESEQQEANNARVSKIEEEEEPEEEESRVSEVRSERSFDFAVKDEERQDRLALGDYRSLWSEFDDFVANEDNGAMAGTSRALIYGFEVGDMVWGKVKSHPRWPGHIFNEAFASLPVRRTRREGHVLVAFFGDSSYGWFDPAELIQFDVNFAEKSQQTSSRTFIKAVEEATDEASRRSALGLACKCRNKYNFRPANVPGYYVVDVSDYEPGGVYSATGETLAFVKQLAVGPHDIDQESFEFIKNKARAFAFRKAVFEEFDETYAQAFAVQSSRPSNDTAKVPNQLAKEPTRAPLSGPLVIAEAPGGEKSSKKPVKVKDHSKKGNYLLKRRDEPSEVRAFEIVQRQAGSSSLAVYVEAGSSAVEAGDFVLQKRASTPHISAKHEQSVLITKEDVDSSEDGAGKAAIVLDHAPGDANVSLDKKGAMQEIKGELGSDVAVGLMSTGWSDLPGKEQLKGVSDCTYEESAKSSRSNQVSQKNELSFSARAEVDSGLSKLQNGEPGSLLSPLNATQSVGTSTGSGVKKVKVIKRPVGDTSSQKSIMGGKKKKEIGAETNPARPKKRLATGKGEEVRISLGKSTHVSFSPGEDSQLNSQKKDGIEFELPQLLSDFLALALDPFHVAERNSHSVTMHFFLRFRSLVFQKSLALSPPSETEVVEVGGTKSLSSIGASDYSASEDARGLIPSKPAKLLVRPNDSTKAGRKRLPSDRQEEIAAKRQKKFIQLKSLAAEKKAQRTLDTLGAEGKETVARQRAEGKQPVAQPPRKSVKPDSFKKTEPPVRAIEPTMLVLRFPPETSLPSAAQLKARFARFGSIDQSAIRVFWKSSQCHVVFRRKLDAQAALKYALGNKSLFGDVNVRYNIREVGAPASEAPESDKSRDDTSVDAAQAEDPLADWQAVAFAHQPPSQSTVQLKSILKRPNGDEAAPVTGGNGSRGNRVKFMLGGEETNSGEQMMVGNRNNFNNNASFADGDAPTASVAMGFSSKNIQKVFPPPPLPILPLPTQFAKAPLNYSHHHTEVAPRNSHNFNTPPPSAGPSTPTIDISQQMLSLLTTCNDVVTSVSGLLGYVPYHPL
ncbi:hypothetical protein NC651_029694 [Populus alba x Populus x berolinensis]|nr:hypothetical protein NC651_029694 [Populus alba x Populus x berolinensis]